MRPIPAPHESLAAFVSHVHPGDPCACCGARLVAADPRDVSACPPASSASHGGTAVWCPACGCEVSDDEVPETVNRRLALSPAA